MLNTFIKNQGSNQTLIRKNNKHYLSQTKWSTDYDGDVANIVIDENDNGVHRQYQYALDNDDLANMLNMESVNMPIDQRLEMDFNNNNDMKPYNIQLIPGPDVTNQYIASPAPNEEFVFAVSPVQMQIQPKRVQRVHRVHRVKRSSSNRRSVRRSVRRSSNRISVRKSIRRSVRRSSSNRRSRRV